MKSIVLFFPVLAATVAWSQVVPNRYIVELTGEPGAVALARAGKDYRIHTSAVEAESRRVQASQGAVRQAVVKAGGRVRGSVDLVMNALMVDLDDSQVDAMRAMPGVKQIYPVTRTKALLDHAIPLQKIPQAWSLLPNGEASAGLGVKIGIFDSGVEAVHPAFQDSSLTPPAGFPKVGAAIDQAFVNSKIIVARNYTLNYSENGVTFPLDFVSDDMDGHGTAMAMSAAGETVTGPYGTITGAAPKAFIGNYKVIDNQGVGFIDSFIVALNDALADGMDIVNYSAGGASAFSQNGGVDPGVIAIENASAAGLLIFVASGNNGPEPGTVNSPAIAPSAVAVGGSESDRAFYPGTLTAAGLVYIAVPGNNSSGDAPVTGTMQPVAALDPTGLACTALPSGSLTGVIALIERGTCTYETKLNNVQQAGAIAAAIYSTVAFNATANPWTQGQNTLPAVLIEPSAGQAIIAAQNAAPALNFTVTLGFKLTPEPQSPNFVYIQSSAGPNPSLGIKPDVLAVADPLSVSTQANFPDGEFYNPLGFLAPVSGTSGSSAIAAGAAAVLKGARPGLTASQLRSLLVNSPSVMETDQKQFYSVQQTGSGNVNLLAAMLNNVTVAPTSLSFGAGGSTVGRGATLTVTNLASSSDTVQVAAFSIDGVLVPQLSNASLTLAPNTSQTITVGLNASGLASGEYTGYIVLLSTLSGVQTVVPYWFAVPGTFAQYAGILSSSGAGSAGQPLVAAYINVTDASRLPFTAVPPTVTPVLGGGSSLAVVPYDAVNAPGVYAIEVVLGATPGVNQFHITVGGHDIQCGGGYPCVLAIVGN